MANTKIDEEFRKGTRIQLGTIRCLVAHAEMGTVEVRSRNGLSIEDPKADIEISAKLKVRDFTTKDWEKSGKGAGRKNLRVLIDLENASIIWKGEDLQICNKDEILQGVRELLTGARRERVPLNPENREIEDED